MLKLCWSLLRDFKIDSSTGLIERNTIRDRSAYTKWAGCTSQITCLISVLRTATCGSRGLLPKSAWEGFQEPEGSRKPKEYNPQSQLRRACRGSQRLKGQLQIIYGSELGPLLISYGSIDGYSHVLIGFPTVGVGPISDSFACFWDIFPPTGLMSSRLYMKVCGQSYCNLLGHVWWISLGDLLFSEGNGWGVCLGKRGDSWGGTGRKERRRNFG